MANRIGSERTNAQVQAGWTAPSSSVPRPIFGRQLEAPAHVALAPPEHHGVDGEHERLEPGAGRPVDHLLDQPPVAPHVHLEPLRAVADRGDLLDRPGAERGERVRHPGAGRRPGRPRARPRGSAIRVKPVGASTSGSGRRRPSRVVDGIDRADVAEHPRSERASGEAVAVGRHRPLVLGAAVDVVEDAARQAAAGDAAQVVDVGRPGQSAGDRISREAPEAEDRPEGLDQTTWSRIASRRAGDGAALGVGHPRALDQSLGDAAVDLGHLVAEALALDRRLDHLGPGAVLHGERLRAVHEGREPDRALGAGDRGGAAHRGGHRRLDAPPPRPRRGA